MSEYNKSTVCTYCRAFFESLPFCSGSVQLQRRVFRRHHHDSLTVQSRLFGIDYCNASNRRYIQCSYSTVHTVLRHHRCGTVTSIQIFRVHFSVLVSHSGSSSFILWCIYILDADMACTCTCTLGYILYYINHN
jgi:hypothetical protein